MNHHISTDAFLLLIAFGVTAATILIDEYRRRNRRTSVHETAKVRAAAIAEKEASAARRERIVAGAILIDSAAIEMDGARVAA